MKSPSSWVNTVQFPRCPVSRRDSSSQQCGPGSVRSLREQFGDVTRTMREDGEIRPLPPDARRSSFGGPSTCTKDRSGQECFPDHTPLFGRSKEIVALRDSVGPGNSPALRPSRMDEVIHTRAIQPACLTGRSMRLNVVAVRAQ